MVESKEDNEGLPVVGKRIAESEIKIRDVKIKNTMFKVDIIGSEVIEKHNGLNEKVDTKPSPASSQEEPGRSSLGEAPNTTDHCPSIPRARLLLPVPHISPLTSTFPPAYLRQVESDVKNSPH